MLTMCFKSGLAPPKKKRKKISPGLWQRIRWWPSKHPNFLSFKVWHPKNGEAVVTLWASSFESTMVHTREAGQQNREEERPFADNFFSVGHTWDPPMQNMLAFIHNKCSPSAIPHLADAARVKSTLDVARLWILVYVVYCVGDYEMRSFTLACVCSAWTWQSIRHFLLRVGC